MSEPRIIGRVKAIEDKIAKGLVGGSVQLSVYTSPADTREAVIVAGEEFTVPTYVVGSNQILIYLDGYLCVMGEDPETSTYMEVGEPEKDSISVIFHDDIAIEHEITVYAYAGTHNMLISGANTREATIVAGTDFPVPSYTVGSRKLMVYIDGILAIGGEDATRATYMEVGNEKDESTYIRFHDDVLVSNEIIIYTM